VSPARRACGACWSLPTGSGPTTTRYSDELMHSSCMPHQAIWYVRRGTVLRRYFYAAPTHPMWPEYDKVFSSAAVEARLLYAAPSHSVCISSGF
jgi:hypothetical protein